jgi:hypothetical protein
MELFFIESSESHFKIIYGHESDFLTIFSISVEWGIAS